MSEMADRMNAIVAALAARVPDRVVTRELKDAADRTPEDLAAGVYTLISKSEAEYPNLRGREGMDGRHGIVLIGHIELPERSTPAEVEDAEFVLIDEVKGFLQNLPASLCRINLVRIQQSAQTEHPYGWIAVELEYVP